MDMTPRDRTAAVIFRHQLVAVPQEPRRGGPGLDLAKFE
jgi:hypothetical protein